MIEVMLYDSAETFVIQISLLILIEFMLLFSNI